MRESHFNLRLWTLVLGSDEMLTKTNLGRKGFIWMTDQSLSLKGAKAGGQVRNLEARTKAETVGTLFTVLFLMACSVGFCSAQGLVSDFTLAES